MKQTDYLPNYLTQSVARVLWGRNSHDIHVKIENIPDLSITNTYSPVDVVVGESSSLGKKFTIN